MDATSNAKEDESKWRIFSHSSSNKTTLGQELVLQDSPGPSDVSKHVVVVHDAVEEFVLDPTEWVLKKAACQTSCKVTILGVKPYLNIPLSTKTSDIWAMNIDDIMTTRSNNAVKYQKVHRLIDLCLKYGIVPQIKTEMGYPVEEVVVEQITNLQATLVIFDRHHRKYKEYYAEKVPSKVKMVMMKDDGEADVIRCNGENSLKETTRLMISGHIKKILKQRSDKSHVEKSEKTHAESSKKSEKSHAESSKKASAKGTVVKVRTDKGENASPPQPSCGNNVKSWSCSQTSTLSPLY